MKLATVPTATSIEEQIHATKARLAAANAELAQLREKRKAALVSGDNAAADKLDQQIGAADRSCAREIERLELLRAELQEATTRAHQEKLDELYRDAERARKIAENIIRKQYAEGAAQVIDACRKLMAVNHFIQRVNDALAGPRPDAQARRVAFPNGIRNEPERIIPATTRKVERLRRGDGYPGISMRYVVDHVEEVPVPEQRVPGVRRAEIYEECVLPPALPGSPSWSERVKDGAFAEGRTSYEAVIEDLLKAGGA